MKTIDDINLYTWFVERELDFVPEHFVTSQTPITAESRAWILEKLTGRFSLKGTERTLAGLLPSFEDPKELVFYELAWA